MYLDPTKRHDFVLLFDVTNGNPNGDPDAGNMPRIDPETSHGFVTDVALKRKIRDYAVLAHDKEIFIQSKMALNSLYYQTMHEEGFALPEASIDNVRFLEWLADKQLSLFRVDLENRRVVYLDQAKEKQIVKNLVEEVGVIPEEYEAIVKQMIDMLAKLEEKNNISAKDRDQIKDAMVRRYYDIRMFGAVLTAGTNAGQVRGPLQITFARSVSPILPMDISITRIAITREEDKRNKKTEMGRKAIIPYGLYRAHGFYNPKLAELLTRSGNPVTREDLEVIWKALQNMFDYDRSAARGEMVFRGLYVFSHDDEKGLGNANAHKLFDCIKIDQITSDVPPRSINDYRIMINDDNLPTGITLTEFS